MAMKITRTICLALTVCAFGAVYSALLTRPLPAPVTMAYYCQPSFQPCYIPVPSVARLMP